MAAGLQGVFHHHFEWDPAKASSNLRKHGIDFGQAATVFEDPLSMSMPDEEANGTEERWVTMGQTQNGRLAREDAVSIIHKTIAQLGVILAREVSEHCAAVHEAAQDGTAKPGGGLTFGGLGASGVVDTADDEERSSHNRRTTS